MTKKKFGKIFFIILFLLTLFIIIYSKFFNKKQIALTIPNEVEDILNNSNIIKDIEYIAKDTDGNEYIITAEQGEIDYSNSNVLYLTKVIGLIRLVNSENITITSKYGKYNSENFDTIFSKNVIINYLNNEITGEYLDFSLERNSLLMTKKNFGKIFFIILFFLTLLVVIYSKFFREKQITLTTPKEVEDISNNSNIIKDIEYRAKDTDGNEYIITAEQGEIDYSNSNVLYLTNVVGLIRLVNSENITITSVYGKYNSENFDTIFSNNVIIDYLDNKITSEYLDFSLERNLMLISKKVVYTNLENILYADVIEVDIQTKDTKIFMYEDKKKVNIKSKN